MEVRSRGRDGVMRELKGSSRVSKFCKPGLGSFGSAKRGNPESEEVHEEHESGRELGVKIFHCN